MGVFFSSCKPQKQQNNNEPDIKDPEIDMVDRDGKTYLQYIMNYESIPYFIPQIKYAKVTDIRPDYTIVVAARLPNKDSPIYRFPIRLKNIENSCEYSSRDSIWKSNLDIKAIDLLIPLICSTIVELKNIENRNGMLYADVYYKETNSVSEWLINNNLVVNNK